MTSPKRVLQVDLALIAVLLTVGIGVWGVLCVTAPVQSAVPPPVSVTYVLEAEYKPIPGSHQKLTGLDTKQSLTVPTGARRCVFYAEDDACRWNDDGTDPDPTTKVGGVIAAGDYYVYNGNLSAVELKGTATTILHVWYYGL